MPSAPSARARRRGRGTRRRARRESPRERARACGTRAGPARHTRGTRFEKRGADAGWRASRPARESRKECPATRGRTPRRRPPVECPRRPGRDARRLASRAAAAMPAAPSSGRARRAARRQAAANPSRAETPSRSRPPLFEMASAARIADDGDRGVDAEREHPSTGTQKERHGDGGPGGDRTFESGHPEAAETAERLQGGERERSREHGARGERSAGGAVDQSACPWRQRAVVEVDFAIETSPPARRAMGP